MENANTSHARATMNDPAKMQALKDSILAAANERQAAKTTAPAKKAAAPQPKAPSKKVVVNGVTIPEGKSLADVVNAPGFKAPAKAATVVTNPLVLAGRPSSDLILLVSFDQQTAELAPMSHDGEQKLSVPGHALPWRDSSARCNPLLRHKAYKNAGGFFAVVPNTPEGVEAGLKRIRGKGVGPETQARRTPENVAAYRAWAAQVSEAVG